MSSDVRAVTWRLETVGITSARAVSSWKCVANKQNDPILVAMYLREKTVFSAHTCRNTQCSQHFGRYVAYSEMAQASPNPSYVEVPLPSSSMITRESLVAVCMEQGDTTVQSTACQGHSPSSP